MVARYHRVFCPDCPLIIEGYGEDPVRRLAKHGLEQHPDPFLLEAMREADALTPSVPPMAPEPSADEVTRRLMAIYMEAIQGPVGWQTSKIEIDRGLYMASLRPRSTNSDITIKEFVENHSHGIKFVCRPAPPPLPASDLDLFERVRK